MAFENVPKYFWWRKLRFPTSFQVPQDNLLTWKAQSLSTQYFIYLAILFLLYYSFFNFSSFLKKPTFELFASEKNTEQPSWNFWDLTISEEKTFYVNIRALWYSAISI